MKNIACYCRVSTRHQKNDSQRAEIDKWIRNNGIDQTTVQWFEDKEIHYALTPAEERH